MDNTFEVIKDFNNKRFWYSDSFVMMEKSFLVYSSRIYETTEVTIPSLVRKKHLEIENFIIQIGK